MGFCLDILLACAVTGLVVGIAIYVMQKCRRAALPAQPDSSPATAAFSATRIEGVQRYNGERDQTFTSTHSESETLLTDSAEFLENLRALERWYGEGGR